MSCPGPTEGCRPENLSTAGGYRAYPIYRASASAGDADVVDSVMAASATDALNTFARRNNVSRYSVRVNAYGAVLTVYGLYSYRAYAQEVTDA